MAPKAAKRRVGRRKVCDTCGELNAGSANECKACGKDRWAPEWVLHLRRINRSVAVQVTKAHEASESDDPRLTLYKWWPGGNATFNVTRAGDWEQIKTIVDTDLAQFLGWKTKKKVAEAAEARRGESDRLGAELEGLAGKDPSLLVELVKGLRLERVTEEDLPKLGDALGDLAQILVGVDESQRLAIRRMVKQLPKQGATAITQLSELMESLTLGQIAAVTGEVARRVGLLDLFRERVLDERTYEITGDGSIHRLLEQAMWIVDERYWLMHSNRQLRTVVGRALAKEDKQFEKKRPDFVCGAVDRKLIVIEIKRPSHTLTVADLNQLERYVVLCGEYDDSTTSHEAILVGHKISDDLRRTLKVRSSAFKVQTYTQLINDTERRYKKYLEALGQ